MTGKWFRAALEQGQEIADVGRMLLPSSFFGFAAFSTTWSSP